MELIEYQNKSASTAIYPDAGRLGGLNYAVLGLAGEAGEVAQKLKKFLRDYGTHIKIDPSTPNVEQLPPEVKIELASELGDVLWYVAAIAREIGWDLDHVAAYNLNKLKRRKEQGTLGGTGDHR